MGDTTKFWGTSAPYSGTRADGVVVPVWTDIAPFWKTVAPMDAATGDTATLSKQLATIYSQSEGFWGKSVQSQTGKSFWDGYASRIYRAYGIDRADPASLAKLNPDLQKAFLFDWYDGLMNFSGGDRVDHWMNEINWNPALTQIQGQGKRSIIGLLDFTVSGDPDVQNRIAVASGVSTTATMHGAGVASLMVAAHDGRGVMGIAPMASVIAYNPYDASGTTNFNDVTNGLVSFATNKADIVNMSLGVPGWTFNGGWADVFADGRLKTALTNTVYVVAAGNDGVSQTANVAWNMANDPALIVVGSIDSAGNISKFSNRPGTACLVDAGGACKTGNRLMDRFIVAPGEWILVSDNAGGTTRGSGTSFAAPLVSGTIALILNRWPWLANYPKETVNIVLKSARDLGAPGTDPVYGVGLLDATAAQSPLSFDAMQWYAPDKKGNFKAVSTGKLVDRVTSIQNWEASGAYFYAFEQLGSGTYRDFAIPLSSRMVGQAVQTQGGYQLLQSYMYQRVLDWVNNTNNGPQDSGKDGFANFTSTQVTAPNSPYNLVMSLAPRTPTPGYRQSSNAPYQASMRLSDAAGRYGLRVGFGDGAALIGTRGLGLVSDYDPRSGGANPLLGMASGGGFVGLDVAVTPHLRLSASSTQKRAVRDLSGFTPNVVDALGSIHPYAAGAQQVAATYEVAKGVQLGLGWTRLHERNSLLGTQSLDPSDFAGGATTDGVTLSANVELGAGFALAGAATKGRTHSAGDAALQVTDAGLASTAYQVAVTKRHLLDSADSLRVSFSQPMHLENGQLSFTAVEVVDRETGALGNVTHTFDLARPARSHVAELLYARHLGQGQLALFGRAQLKPNANEAGVMAGASLKLGF